MYPPTSRGGYTLRSCLSNYGDPNCPATAFDRAFKTDRDAYLFARPYLWSSIPKCDLCGSAHDHMPLPDFPSTPHHGLLSLRCTNPTCRNYPGVHYGAWAATHRYHVDFIIRGALYLKHSKTTLVDRMKLLYLCTREPELKDTYLKQALCMSRSAKAVFQKMSPRFLAPLLLAIEDHVDASRDRGFRTSGL